MENAAFYLVPVVIAAYYLVVWWWIGRKSSPGSIVVRYQPPAGLSPAAMRYLLTMNADGRTFAAILAQLALFGFVAIIPDKKSGVVTINKLQHDRRSFERLSPEEKLVFKNFFEWQPAVELKTPDPRLMEKVKESMETITKQYITRNLIWVSLAVLASGLASAWIAFSLGLFGSDEVDSYVMTAFTGLTVAMLIAASAYVWDRSFQAVKLAVRGLYHRRVLAFLFFLIVLYPAMWYLLMRGVAPLFANVTGLLALVNMFAAPALRSYSPAGRQLLHEIMGFRQFLQRAEQDRLQRLNLPDQPIQADQQYLPYAIALDVREAWGDQLGIKAMVETAL